MQRQQATTFHIQPAVSASKNKSSSFCIHPGTVLSSASKEKTSSSFCIHPTSVSSAASQNKSLHRRHFVCTLRQFHQQGKDFIIILYPPYNCFISGEQEQVVVVILYPPCNSFISSEPEQESSSSSFCIHPATVSSARKRLHHHFVSTLQLFHQLARTSRRRHFVFTLR